MKKFYAGLVVAGLLALTGCGNTSSTGGGTGAPGKGGTFKLTGPSGTTTLKQGQKEEVKVKIDKGKDFKEDINFTTEVTPPDKGVKASVAPATWKPSETPEVIVTLEAGDAATGDYQIKVRGTPAKGQPVDSIFKVNVPEKKAK